MNIQGPGSHTFYTVEVFNSKLDRWSAVSDHHLAGIPEALRWNGQKELEPVRSFGACGSVWQKTGNDGYETPDQAIQLLHLLEAAWLSRKFRIVQVTVNMRYDFIGYSQ